MSETDAAFAHIQELAKPDATAAIRDWKICRTHHTALAVTGIHSNDRTDLSARCDLRKKPKTQKEHLPNRRIKK